MKELSGNSGSSEGFDNRRLNGSFDKQQIMNSKQEFSGEVAGKKEKPQKFFDEATHVSPRKEKEKPFVQPDTYRFVGPAVSNERIEEAKTWIENYKFNDVPEERKTLERKGQIIEMKNILVEFGKEKLGVDLSHSLPEQDKFHFYTETNFNQAVEATGFSKTEGGMAKTLPSGDMLIIEDASTTLTLLNTNHELIHAVRPKLVTMSENKNNWSWPSLVGAKNGTGVVDEVLTEMTNLELKINRWKENPSLVKERGGGIAYLENIIVFDDLVMKVAGSQGISYQEILRHLQKGMVLGDEKALEIISDDIGKDATNILLEWKNPELKYVNQYNIYIAEKIGLQEARRKLESNKAGEDIQLLEGLFDGQLIIKSQTS